MGICNVLYDKDHAGNLIAAVTVLATVIFGSCSIGFSAHCWRIQQMGLGRDKAEK